MMCEHSLHDDTGLFTWQAPCDFHVDVQRSANYFDKKCLLRFSHVCVEEYTTVCRGTLFSGRILRMALLSRLPPRCVRVISPYKRYMLWHIAYFGLSAIHAFWIFWAWTVIRKWTLRLFKNTQQGVQWSGSIVLQDLDMFKHRIFEILPVSPWLCVFEICFYNPRCCPAKTSKHLCTCNPRRWIDTQILRTSIDYTWHAWRVSVESMHADQQAFPMGMRRCVSLSRCILRCNFLPDRCRVKVALISSGI